MKEIYLHSNLSKEDGEIDSFSAINFYKQLHEIERSKQPIVIHLHTIGGNWDDGMSIYDNLLYSNCPTTVIGHGCVYSIGTIIIQSAKRRFLMPSCSFMIHYGSCHVSGEHKSAVNTMSYYRCLEQKMIDIYAQKCVNGEYFASRNYSLSKVKTFLKTKLDKTGDWYMSANEAVEYGFADKVLSKREYNYVRKVIQRTNKSAK